MKKNYSAPEAQLILLYTESILGPSVIIDVEDGNGDATELLPIKLF